MTRLAFARSLIVAVGATALVAACGANAQSHSGSRPASGLVIRSETVTLSGKTQSVLTDGSGRTLYYFLGDQGGKVTCTAGCAKEWMPVKVSGKPAGAAGITGTLGTAPDPAGGSVATYNGWPLYTYIGDTGPHQTHGDGVNDFGAKWYATRINVPPTGGGQQNGYGGGY